MKRIEMSLHVDNFGKLVPKFKFIERRKIDRKTELLTDHDYIDYLINRNLESENYEKCQKLLKLKNKIPNNKIKRHRIL